ncbi:acetyl-CoA carboxyl transferase [Streptacidiphilus pinicola]|uniref:Acetyl-coenzyme A carboxylase carboxyl transferase subunits beta/alpha n=1 Tax=Streptacidiphilus pinicola TaxID=2219663 RepID=A0A2X0III6_9ACTN|nr:carboxyl transferase domain-containing protein [Streptacidiphilus pinicola]RAG83423.1 acetyl-CoA carboxyl transferase [Streptacidiphilus pinicola]
MTPPAAARFAQQLLDPGSWIGWDAPPRGNPVSGPYADTLARAEKRSGGADESVRTGEGRIDGHRIALIVGEFDFLAGSIGVAACDRLVRAVHRATAERLPLLACPATGGTRMQEGTPAFVGMVPIVTALAAHKAAGLPYLVHLRHPCTGGVLASWGSVGQITTAEPGALIGFLGPRVYEALYGHAFPEGIQRAEHLAHLGVVDAVLTPDALRTGLADLLPILSANRAERGLPAGPESGGPETPTSPVASSQPHAEGGPWGDAEGSGAERGGDVWRSVGVTRSPSRPGLREVLATADGVVRLSGTQDGQRDEALSVALARFGEVGCVVVGHDRAGAEEQGEDVGPGGLRAARRGMRLAAELRLPLLTVIDTAGARLSRAAEEGALAGEIARCLQDLTTLPVPTLSLLLGRGTGGAALALLPADRVLAAEHAWLAPLPPEGASEILYRTTERAPELAVAQRIGAAELLRAGTVDRIVPEPDTADAFVRAMSDALRAELAALPELADLHPARLAEQRGRRGAPLV